MKTKYLIIIIIGCLSLALLFQHIFLGAPLSKFISRVTLSPANAEVAYLGAGVAGNEYALKYLCLTTLEAYYQPQTNSFFVLGPDYNDVDNKQIAYKINEQGTVVDSLEIDKRNSLLLGDVLFLETGYKDWMTTNDTIEKEYAKIEHTYSLTDEEFEKTFNDYYQKAEQVYYSRHHIAYFNIDDEWYILNDSPETQNQTPIDREWDWEFHEDEIFKYKDYPRKISREFIPLSEFSTDSGQMPDNVNFKVEHFVKEYRYPFGILDPTSLMWTGSLYLSLRYKNDVLKFKISAGYLDQEYRSYPNIFILQVPYPYTDKTDIFFLVLRGRFGPIPRDGGGLYIVCASSGIY